MTTTADRLRQVMIEKDLTQADVIERAKPLADKYGVKLTRPDMSQYCAGKVKPSQGKLFLLAAALDVDEGWLLGYDVPQSRREPFESEVPDSFVTRMFRDDDGSLPRAYARKEFDDTINDDERNIITAFRKADDRTRRMVTYMLGMEDLKNGNR